jgi:uncharacterized protein (TIRG00374 family)
MKNVLRLAIPFLITAFALYWAFHDVTLDGLGSSFARAQYFPGILGFLAFFAVHFYFRSLRWRYLLPEAPSGKAIPLRQLFDSMMLGNLATFVFPFRLGEFIRPLILSRWTSYSFSTAFVSVVIERFFDLAAVLLAFAAILPFFPSVDAKLMSGALALATLSGGLFIFLVCGSLFPSVTKKTVEAFSRFLPKKLANIVDHFASDLIRGASVVKTPSRLFMIIVLTAVVWAFAWLQFYALLFIFPHEQSLLLSVARGVCVALAIAAPSAPGFLGAFQLGCEAAFILVCPGSGWVQLKDGSYSLSADGGVYSLVVNLLSYVLFIGIGFWLLRLHGLSLFDLKKAAQTGKEESGKSAEECAA